MTGSANFAGYTQQVNFSFDDIGGQAPAKQELKEALILSFMQENKRNGNPASERDSFDRPPGTGKTLLAKAASYTHSAFLAT